MDFYVARFVQCVVFDFECVSSLIMFHAPSTPHYAHETRRATFLLMLIAAFIAIAPCAVSLAQEWVSLRFQNAELQGRLQDRIVSFEGIPYAQPPVGPNRFRPPIPISSLSGTINATRFGKSCLQQASSPFFTIPDEDTSEDCLFINVYTPVNRTRLPVFVWVYGGSFSSGSTAESRYNGRLILQNHHDFVFVSFNYRTGVLGFMGSSQLAQEGSLNAGLLDQKLAFQWIRNNIQSFGGDPTQITAVGESAGAISIGALLMMNGGQEALFDRAILISGAPGLFHPTAEQLQPNFNRVSQSAGCGNDTSSVLECLRRVEPLRLRDAGNQYGQYEPILDGNVVPQSIDAFQSGRFMRVPVMIHLNQDEGTFFALNVFTEAQARRFIERQVPYLSQTLIEQAQTMYLQNASSSFQAAAQFQADQIFNCAGLQAARFYKSQSQVFKVMNRHVNVITAPINFVRDLGVYHTSELPHLFQDTRFIAGSEQAFSRRLQNHFLSFAKTGNPGFENYNRDLRFDIANNRMESDDDLNEKCAFLFNATNIAISSQRNSPSPTVLPTSTPSFPTIVISIPNRATSAPFTTSLSVNNLPSSTASENAVSTALLSATRSPSITSNSQVMFDWSLSILYISLCLF
jgi:carboxylesterase type B